MLNKKIKRTTKMYFFILTSTCSTSTTRHVVDKALAPI